MGTARAYFDSARRRRVPRAAHRAGPGARGDEEAGRRGARDDGRRAPQPPVHRAGRALRARRRSTCARMRSSPRPSSRSRAARSASSTRARRRDARGRDLRRREGRAELRDRRPGLDARSRSTCARSTRRCCRRCSPTRRRRRRRAAKKHLVKVEWSPLLHITPRLFDETLMAFVRDVGQGGHRQRAGAAVGSAPRRRRDGRSRADRDGVRAEQPRHLAYAASRTRPARRSTSRSARSLTVDRTLAHYEAAAAGRLEGAPSASQGW